MEPKNGWLERIGSTYGSIDELTRVFREFSKGAQRTFFDLVVKHMWLERQFTFNGTRRTRRYGNGHEFDAAFAWYMRSVVGIDPKVLTRNSMFSATASYIKDFFPDFLAHDPFKEPEKYAFPYKHVTLDHMFFVSQCDERLEMLEHADKMSMSYAEFANWAHNHVRCYNKERGDDFPILAFSRDMKYLKNPRYPHPHRRIEL